MTKAMREMGNPPVELSDRLISLMKRKYGRPMPVLVRLRLTQGPCRDDWCQPIRKLDVSLVTDGSVPPATISMEACPGAVIDFDERIFESVLKSRSRIFIDTAPFGRMKIEGVAYM